MPTRDNIHRSLASNVFFQALSYVGYMSLCVLPLLLGEVDAGVRIVRVGSEAQDHAQFTAGDYKRDDMPSSNSWSRKAGDGGVIECAISGAFLETRGG